MAWYRCSCGNRRSRFAITCTQCHDRKMEAIRAKIERANAILADKYVTLNTAFGPHRIVRFNYDLTASCLPQHRTDSWLNRTTFHLHSGHLDQVLSGATVIAD